MTIIVDKDEILNKIHVQVLKVENKYGKNHSAIRMEWVKLKKQNNVPN